MAEKRDELVNFYDKEEAYQSKVIGNIDPKQFDNKYTEEIEDMKKHDVETADVPVIKRSVVLEVGTIELEFRSNDSFVDVVVRDDGENIISIKELDISYLKALAALAQ